MNAAVPGTTFATLLRRHRQAAGLTQEELAERAGLSTRRVQDLERGLRRFPHADTTRRLANALGLSDRDGAALRTAGAHQAAVGEGVTAWPGFLALPVKLSSFVGRQHELTELRHRLVSTGWCRWSG